MRRSNTRDNRSHRRRRRRSPNSSRSSSNSTNSNSNGNNSGNNNSNSLHLPPRPPVATATCLSPLPTSLRQPLLPPRHNPPSTQFPSLRRPLPPLLFPPFHHPAPASSHSHWRVCCCCPRTSCSYLARCCFFAGPCPLCPRCASLCCLFPPPPCSRVAASIWPGGNLRQHFPASSGSARRRRRHRRCHGGPRWHVVAHGRPWPAVRDRARR